MKIEERLYVASLGIEERAAESGLSSVVFTGQPIVFNKPSRPLWEKERGWFTEIIEPGAIDDTTDTAEVLAVFNHDENRLLGANYSGTLRFSVADDGVNVAIDKPNNSVGNDCEEWVRRGDIRGMSFKFVVGRDRWEVKDNVTYRYIAKIDKLLDMSLVTRAAYLQTSVDMATRSHTPEARMYSVPGEQKPLSKSDSAFVSGLIANCQAQVEFISAGIAAIESPQIKQIAANRLADAIYMQNWLTEVMAEMTTTVKPQPEEATTDTEVPQPTEQDSKTPEPQEEGRSLDLALFKAKNRVHYNTLNKC